MFESMIERIAREYLVVRVSWRNVKFFKKCGWRRGWQRTHFVA